MNHLFISIKLVNTILLVVCCLRFWAFFIGSFLLLNQYKVAVFRWTCLRWDCRQRNVSPFSTIFILPKGLVSLPFCLQHAFLIGWHYFLLVKVLVNVGGYYWHFWLFRQFGMRTRSTCSCHHLFLDVLIGFVRFVEYLTLFFRFLVIYDKVFHFELWKSF